MKKDNNHICPKFEADNQLIYWKKILSGNIIPLQIYVDHSQPLSNTISIESTHLNLTDTLVNKLQKFVAEKKDLSLEQLCLAVYALLLMRYAQQDEITISTIIKNSISAANSLDELTPLHIAILDSMTFKQYANQWKKTLKDAQENLPVSFTRILKELNSIIPEKNNNYLFQVIFDFHTSTSSNKNIDFEHINNKNYCFDIALQIKQSSENMRIELYYNTKSFSKKMMDDLLMHYQVLLEAAITQPEGTIFNLPLLSKQEKQQILIAWNKTQVDFPNKCIHQLFEEQVKKTPDATAISFENSFLNYEELNRRANQLASYLIKQKVNKEKVVAICLERSPEIYISLLGVLKAGAAYLPLDTEIPADRLAFMLKESQAQLIITQQSLANKLEKLNTPLLCLDTQAKQLVRENDQNPNVNVTTNNLAYIIYTSGSTGLPKGVLLEHRGLSSLSTLSNFDGQTQRRVLQFAPFAFDASISDCFMALLSGGELCMISKEALGSGFGIVKFLQEKHITAAIFPPSLLMLLPPEAFPELKTVVAVGEACPQEVIARWSPNRRFFNGYGPTETTICATLAECNNPHEKPTIGRPINNTEIYILDAHLQPVPIGIPGEIHIGGVGLARGYLNRPELTNSKFIANPFSAKTNARLYKTGDLARFLPDGRIDFLGRLDRQVKLHGLRIELDEIETVLQQHPAAQEVAVTIKTNKVNDKFLVAYIVPKEMMASDAFRQFVKEKLPHYMVPSLLIMLNQPLPRLPSGKINYHELPDPESFLTATEEQYVAPRNSIESHIEKFCIALLQQEKISMHTNLLEIGLHSLLVMQLITRIRDIFQTELPVKAFYEKPTIAQIAEYIEKDAHKNTLPSITSITREKPLPLSYDQTRLWYLDQLDPNSAAYNLCGSIAIEGELQTSLIEKCLNTIVQRHETLRTIFLKTEQEPLQKILPDLKIKLQHYDLRKSDKKTQQQQIKQIIKKETNKPFELDKSPLLRAALLQLIDKNYQLVLTMHHIISDEWSLAILLHEFASLYKTYALKQPLQLPDLPIQYADFSVWQQTLFTQGTWNQQAQYWKEKLANTNTTLNLPFDHVRPLIPSYRGAIKKLILNKSVAINAFALAKKNNASLFMFLVSVFNILLYRYTQQEDILVGTPIANRNQSEIANLIGFFVNTLILRTDLSGNPTFQTLLERVRQVAIEAYENQNIPFDQLVVALNPERRLNNTPLIQVLFVLQNAPTQSLEIPGLKLALSELYNETAKFDLTFSVGETSEGLSLTVEYSTDLFESTTIQRMINHYCNLLQSAIASPEQTISQLPMLSEQEKNQLLFEWNKTYCALPNNKTISQLFEEQAEKTPNNIAVIYEDQSFTYQEFNEKANQFAHYLRTLNVKPETLVAICMERSLELLISIFGILKAGGAYVPLDPTQPEKRLSFILEDSNPAILITESTLANKFSHYQGQLILIDKQWKDITANSKDNLPSLTKLENLAYVTYTSGSTGKPKGVLIEQKSVINFLCSMQEKFPLEKNDAYLFKTNFAFDVSVTELFGWIFQGGKLVILKNGDEKIAKNIFITVNNHKITHINFVPSTLQIMLDDISDLDIKNMHHLKYLFTGGEPISKNLVGTIKNLLGKTHFINIYGPTETTVWATSFDLKKNFDSINTPIGKPLHNITTYILDNHLQMVPTGVIGELYIGGSCLARGYLNRPELTTEKFIRDPFNNESNHRLYKTGDLCRYLPDGNIEYLGRIDHQVKLRGFRIELGEIEFALRNESDIKNALVIVHEHAGNKYLVAYLIRHNGILEGDAAKQRNKKLKNSLGDQLPEYMIPSVFVYLSEMPLTASGKINRHALPAPEAILKSTDKIKPRNDVELELTHIWQKLLNVDDIGVTDNFFDLGGHSLLATRIIGEIAKKFNANISLAAFNINPTIEQLATLMHQTVKSTHWSPLIALQPNGNKLPFYCVHPAGGNPLCYIDLARNLGNDQPFYALQALGLDGVSKPQMTIEEMATTYIQAIRAIQPHGPYQIGGWSMGGTIAFEMAYQLEQRGEKVSLLALLDTISPELFEVENLNSMLINYIRFAQLPINEKDLAKLDSKQKISWILSLSKTAKVVPDYLDMEQAKNLYELYQLHNELAKSYKPKKYEGTVNLFRVTDTPFPVHEKSYGWDKYTDKITVHEVSGDHYTLFQQPNLGQLIVKLKNYLKN